MRGIRRGADQGVEAEIAGAGNTAEEETATQMMSMKDAKEGQGEIATRLWKAKKRLVSDLGTDRPENAKDEELAVALLHPQIVISTIGEHTLEIGENASKTAMRDQEARIGKGQGERMGEGTAQASRKIGEERDRGLPA